MIDLKKIRIDGGTQPRSEIDYSIVNEYAEAMQEGDTFPPVVVFNDGANYWLADGFHRYHASVKLGFYEIEAQVKPGTKRDAVLYSVSANHDHGLRRSNADKRKAVLTLLEDEEWSKWSNNRISQECGVSLDLVNRVRDSLNDSLSDNSERTYTTKHGTTATMKTDNIGNRPENPDSSDSTNNASTQSSDDIGIEESFERVREERKGIGLQKAHEAIAILKQIPPDDDLLQEGYDIIIRWINHNR